MTAAHETKKAREVLDQLVQLRVIVGYLGQGKVFGWWNCDFLDATGIRFLETTFPRTAHAAAIRATAEAAGNVHDQALGRIGSFHLFRLPSAIEDRAEHACGLIDWSTASRSIESRESALESLSRMADGAITAPAGPVQIGVERKILSSTAVHELAAHYHSAFRQGLRCFPYFAPDKNGP
ncbi:MAG: BrxE family protein [Limisphaerales bacterium]